MSLKDIINQDNVADFLLASFKADRIAGVYLFLGKEGTGRSQMAREFAKLINCENVGDDSCGKCLSCRKIDGDKLVDVHWYKPINSTISIAQIRDLEKYMYLKPYEAKRKVFIICDAQHLIEESSNALLKTLEEPAKDATIILITSDTAMLLPTISSRCQKVVFNALDESRIKDILVHQHKVPLLHAHFISYLSEGSLGKALYYKELKDTIFDKRTNILNAIYFKKFSLYRMEEFNIKDNTEKRNNLCLLLDILLSWFRDLLIIKAGINTDLINLDKKEELIRLKDKYTQQDLINNMNNIVSTKFLIGLNVNVRLAMSKLRADLWIN